MRSRKFFFSSTRISVQSSKFGSNSVWKFEIRQPCFQVIHQKQISNPGPAWPGATRLHLLLRILSILELPSQSKKKTPAPRPNVKLNDVIRCWFKNIERSYRPLNEPFKNPVVPSVMLKVQPRVTTMAPVSFKVPCNTCKFCFTIKRSLNPKQCFSCDCPDNTAGDHCEDLLSCQDSNPCGHGAVCTVFNHKKVCSCPPGTSGDPLVSCDLRSKQACLSGDPHFTTFDGTTFDYQGSCPYYIMTSCNSSDEFSVIGTNLILSYNKK